MLFGIFFEKKYLIKLKACQIWSCFLCVCNSIFRWFVVFQVLLMEGWLFFSLRASIESNLHYTKHGMPCTTWPHIDLLIEIQFIEIHSGLKYVARMTVLYYGAVKDLFFISKRNMATRILWKMLTRIFCEKCLELSLTRIFDSLKRRKYLLLLKSVNLWVIWNKL